MTGRYVATTVALLLALASGAASDEGQTPPAAAAKPGTPSDTASYAVMKSIEGWESDSRLKITDSGERALIMNFYRFAPLHAQKKFSTDSFTLDASVQNYLYDVRDQR